MKKYVICPGYVNSKTDGQRHFVSSYALMKCYGIDPKDCVVRENAVHPSFASLPHLWPRHEGDYAQHLESLMPNKQTKTPKLDLAILKRIGKELEYKMELPERNDRFDQLLFRLSLAEEK